MSGISNTTRNAWMLKIESFTQKDVKIKGTPPYEITSADCFFSETRTKSSVSISHQEALT